MQILSGLLTWPDGVVWTLIAADAAIATSFIAFSIALLNFIRRGHDHRALLWLAGLFGAFILSFGLTHLMDICVLWWPDYGLQAFANALTAALSIATAILVWPLIPRVLRIPASEKLSETIATLEAEVQKRLTIEQTLYDSQQNLALTLASIEAGFLSTDRAGNVTHMNTVAEQLLGWKESEAIGLSMCTVFARTDRPPSYLSKNPVDDMLEEQISPDVARHVTAISRTGQRTPVEVKATLIHASDGSVRGLATVFRDLSKMIRFGAETDRLAAIVSSSHDAIIGKTLDGTITSWNGAAQTLFGYSAGEAIGQPIQMLIPLERLHEEMQILYQLNRNSHIAPFETERRTKNGALIHVQIAISPIHDANGTIVGASKIARDMSEMRRHEAAVLELASQNRTLLETSRAKSQFLASMSHELRTPLNAIIGFSDLLQGGYVPADSPKREEFLGLINSSGRHLLQLINDVLDLSKVESGKFTFRPQPIVLQQVIDEVVEIVQKGLLKKHIIMQVVVGPGLTHVELDPARLKQVLFNYLSNAIKFTPDGGRVTVRAEAVGDNHFRLEVEDTGLGIAAEDISKLFVEFQQLDSTYSWNQEGTGLGLALTRKLVWAQGGSVGVSSTVGVGSVFHAVLNRVHGTDSEQLVELEAPAHRLLVIEGNHDNRMQLLRELTKAGFRVDGASNGQQALNRTGNTSYDALVLDLMLPDQHGLKVLADIRSAGLSQVAPVVSVSVPTAAGDTAGFAISDVLTKPIRIDEIVAAMTRFRLQFNTRANVLVIDDDPHALDLMSAMLKSIGIDSICMSDGREALMQMDDHAPDAIILDLMMPEFDGFAMLHALRSMPKWRETPIFIWTSMMLDDDEYASLSATATTILSKGGGDIVEMLTRLRTWRPPMLPVTGQAGELEPGQVET